MVTIWIAVIAGKPSDMACRKTLIHVAVLGQGPGMGIIRAQHESPGIEPLSRYGADLRGHIVRR